MYDPKLLVELLEKKIHILDGAMGTMIKRKTFRDRL